MKYYNLTRQYIYKPPFLPTTDRPGGRGSTRDQASPEVQRIPVFRPEAWKPQDAFIAQEAAGGF